MKAEDLMIGNWVSFKGKKNYKVVMADSSCEVGGLDGIELCPIEEWQPIPLTEENIVELLGFEKLKIDWYYKIITINGAYIQLPKHVHKLQQLIKSLEE